ncbi:MAG: hypothetical protein ACTS6G_02595 [Candidatus Hodgkinia cicadicola]
MLDQLNIPNLPPKLRSSNCNLSKQVPNLFRSNLTSAIPFTYFKFVPLRRS